MKEQLIWTVIEIHKMIGVGFLWFAAFVVWRWATQEFGRKTQIFLRTSFWMFFAAFIVDPLLGYFGPGVRGDVFALGLLLVVVTGGVLAFGSRQHGEPVK
jgi:hypothetical protein